MNVVYRGVLVSPVDRSAERIRIETTNMNDAQKAGIPFSEMRNGKAVFAEWVPETDLVPLDTA
ncbi:MAG: hypothetical protein KDC35_17880 [Acidobacteria bacterium]|nr:hypothetical protein [Acidobacteriota bacterium]